MSRFPSATVPIHDPLWGHIQVLAEFIPIIRSEPFVKLASIRQLGPTYLVYPGATHTRFNHSIGVFHVATRFIQALDGQNGHHFSPEGVRAFLCAALCHDLGHFPYTHSLKELPLEEHEALTATLVTAEPILGQIRAAGVDPEAVAAIIDHRRLNNNQEVAWYRRFLSGVLDPDKIDYLRRDAYFCGLPYGTQDLDYILRCLFFTPDSGLGIDEDGVHSIEHVLFSKYLMYRSVYWHAAVRIATGMIKKALYFGLRQNLIQATDLYGLTDSAFDDRFAQAAEPNLRQIHDVFLGRLHTLVWEAPCHQFAQAATSLADLERRQQTEAELARLIAKSLGRPCAASEVLIDIPESVSFEVHIPVRTRGGLVDYPESSTVLSPAVVRNFTDSLRLIRVAVAPRVVADRDRDTQRLAPLLAEFFGGLS